MSDNMIQYLVVGLVIGAILGILLASFISPKLRKQRQIKKELETVKQELANQKQVIAKHFSHSAELLDNMARDFRSLYQHMAENSSNLLSDEDLKLINKDTSATLDNNFTQSLLEQPPKDYSGNPSGLLKPESEPK